MSAGLRRRLGDPERGATSLEMAFYTPLLMLVIFLTVQFALSWHGNQIASAVAREAARAARAGGGTVVALDEAEARGVAYAEAIGGAALTDVAVDARAVGDDEVEVTVTGRAVEIVGGFAPRVSVTVRGPVEEFRPDV